MDKCPLPDEIRNNVKWTELLKKDARVAISFLHGIKAALETEWPAFLTYKSLYSEKQIDEFKIGDSKEMGECPNVIWPGQPSLDPTTCPIRSGPKFS